MQTITVVEFNECASNPCENDASCAETDVPPEASMAEQLFVCTCMPGWMGNTCGVDIDECASIPCQNSGACKDSYDNPVAFVRVCDEVNYTDYGDSGSGSWGDALALPAAVENTTNSSNVTEYSSDSWEDDSDSASGSAVSSLDSNIHPFRRLISCL